MPATNFVQLSTLDAWLNNTSFSLPSTLFVALFTTAPAVSGTSFTGEVAGGSYSRAALTTGTASASGSGASVANSTVVQFPEATASWGTPAYFGICDAQTGGHLLFYGSLSTAFAVTSGMAPKFNIGELVVTAV